MSHMTLRMSVCALAVGAVLAGRGYATHAQDRDDRDDRNEEGGRRVKKVFVVAMENHNWTQPNPLSSPQQIFQNVAAPYINSLVNGTSGISSQVSYATNYQNAGVGVHPSEPNYVWAEAGQPGNSLGTDNDPFVKNTCAVDTSLNTDQHLTAFLTRAGKTWRSYQEDVNVNASNVPLAPGAWTSPIFSASGSWTSPATNAYYYTAQFNYAAKHNPMIFFRDTNGGCPATLSTEYPPLQQLALDLQSDNLADYTWITPNQFNDQHSRLGTGYGVYPSSSDQAGIAQGDNFLARIVPLLMSSRAYQDGAAIILWWDESEGGDSAAFTLPFIVISKRAQANKNGLPFASAGLYSHSSFLRTMQMIFNVDPDEGFPFLGAAAGANDLLALFEHGAIK